MYTTLQLIGHRCSFLCACPHDLCPFRGRLDSEFPPRLRRGSSQGPATRGRRGLSRSAFPRRAVCGAPPPPPPPQPSALCTVLSLSSSDPVPGGGVTSVAEGWACHSEQGAGAHSRLCSSFGGGRGHPVPRRRDRGLARRPPRSVVGRAGPRSGEKEDRFLVTHKPQLSRGAREVFLMLPPAEMETGRSPGLGLPM